MLERELRILKSKISPMPKKMKFFDGTDYRIENHCKVAISVPSNLKTEVRHLLLKLFHSYWHAEPALEMLDAPKKKIDAEGYEIKVTADTLKIASCDKVGVMNALRSLRQLAEEERCVEFFEAFILPQCEIQDKPTMTFRGLHLCWFPETSYLEMEKQIRLAAYYKYNHVVIENWGIYPFKCHPEFCFQDVKIKRSDMRKLVDLCYELGMTPIPQINIFGHASWARGGSAKHATLGRHPEFASLFEPATWSWCLTNPKTKEYLTDMIDELLEVFHNPPFFHGGCDEAYDMASCSSCRKLPAEKVVGDHLLYFYDYLKKRNVRFMMWHDMLLERDAPGDPWSCYVTCAHHADGMGDLYKKLPKDIVICDWQYWMPNRFDPKMKVTWKTTRFFQAAGFDVLVCPWYEYPCVKDFITFGCKAKTFGMLQTTWHRNRGFQMQPHFNGAAAFAWNPESQPSETVFNLTVHHVDRDMGLGAKYTETGRSNYQIAPASYPD